MLNGFLSAGEGSSARLMLDQHDRHSDAGEFEVILNAFATKADAAPRGTAAELASVADVVIAEGMHKARDPSGVAASPPSATSGHSGSRSGTAQLGRKRAFTLLPTAFVRSPRVRFPGRGTDVGCTQPIGLSALQYWRVRDVAS